MDYYENNNRNQMDQYGSRPSENSNDANFSRYTSNSSFQDDYRNEQELRPQDNNRSIEKPIPPPPRTFDTL